MTRKDKIGELDEMDKNNISTPPVSGLQNRLKELENLATKDSLTGLLNRAALEDYIGIRLKNLKDGERCAFFIVDIDNFKEVNDRLGHLVGDRAISQAAQILSGLFRAGDIVGRLGGDEFVVFLSGKVTEESARQKAEAICESVFIALGSENIINLTASVGVCFSDERSDFETMYITADYAMYKAKKSGKHRYCILGSDKHPDSRTGISRTVNFVQLSAILENMGSGLALLKMSSSPELIYVSPSFCRLMGVDYKSYRMPRPLSDIIHPDDMKSLVRKLRDSIEYDMAVEHSHRVTSDMGKSWMWWHVVALRIEHEAEEPVFLITTTDISTFKEEERRKEDQIWFYKTALELTSKWIWDVDIEERLFHPYSRDGKYDQIADGIRRFPEGLIESGWIHADSVERFRAFSCSLLNGKSEDFGNFAVRLPGREDYIWVSLSYRMTYDESGSAKIAVGFMEELP